MSDSLGLAIVGSGFMGRTYSECLAKYVQGGRLLAVSGGTRAPALAADYGAEHVPEFRDLLRRRDVQALILTTPEQLHPQQAIDALQADKHVLVEKPLAATVQECQRVQEAARAATAQLMVVKHWRYRGVYQAARQALAAGLIGTVRQIRHQGLFPLEAARIQVAKKPFYAEPAGGGIYMGFNSHIFDLVHYLAGAEPVRVNARGGTTHGTELGGELSVDADIEFSNGVVAHVWSDIEYPVAVTAAQQFTTTVIGSKGVLELPGYSHADLVLPTGRRRLYQEKEFDQRDPMDPPRLAGYARMVQEFVDAATQGREPAITASDGRVAVELCLAVRQSAQQGESVSLS